jgi:hypothetical protein
MSSNIREILGFLIGNELLDITSEDEADRKDGRDPFIELLFENGATLKFFILDSDLYKAAGPLCFSDPSRVDDDLYHPDPSDAEAHKWVAVKELTEDGEIMHVIPCFGKLHAINEICDCQPKKEFRDDGSWFFNHEEMTDGVEAPSADSPQT